MKQDKYQNFGAVICFSDNNGGAGHVAIVEQINQDGSIRCSNSAWQSTFFWISDITPNAQERYNWSHYTHQGFIYNPFITPTPPTPPPTEIKKRKFPWAIYSRILRAKRGQ